MAMSFHSPLSKRKESRPSSPDNRQKQVACDLPHRLAVLDGEVALVEAWMGNLLTELLNGTAFEEEADHPNEIE